MSQSRPEEIAVPAVPAASLPTEDPTTPTEPTPEELGLAHKYTEPLYTEIKIDLPPFPSPERPKSGTTSANAKGPSTDGSAPKSRSRAHTLSSMSPFHRRRGSSPSVRSPSPTRSDDGKYEGKRNESAMSRLSRGRQGKRRSGTVDALAVAPAIMILKAELFTPQEKREDGEEVRGR